VVIPLLIGTSRKDVEAAFPAIEVFEHQYLQVAEADDAEAAIAEVAEVFHQTVDPDDQLGLWARQLDRAISDLNDHYQSQLALALRASEQAWPGTPNGRQLVVHALLHAPRMFASRPRSSRSCGSSATHRGWSSW
jgi:hypothetical protein